MPQQICYCRKQREKGDIVIVCGKCQEYYHGRCVQISSIMALIMKERKLMWFCQSCNDLHRIDQIQQHLQGEIRMGKEKHQDHPRLNEEKEKQKQFQT